MSDGKQTNRDLMEIDCMTFQYFFFDTYPGYFVEALPLAVIIAAVYGVIRFRKGKTTPTSRKVISSLFVCYMVGLVVLVLLLDVMQYSWYRIIYHMDGGNAPRFFDLKHLHDVYERSL